MAFARSDTRTAIQITAQQLPGIAMQGNMQMTRTNIVGTELLWCNAYNGRKLANETAHMTVIICSYDNRGLVDILYVQFRRNLDHEANLTGPSRKTAS